MLPYLLHDYDSPFGGLIAVNVVHPCAGPTNDLQFLSRCDDISGYLGGWPNDESVVILKNVQANLIYMIKDDIVNDLITLIVEQGMKHLKTTNYALYKILNLLSLIIFY